MQVLRDPCSAKPYVLFYRTKRVGGGVQDFDANKVLKFAVSQRAMQATYRACLPAPVCPYRSARG